MRDPDRAMEIYRRLLAEDAEQSSSRESVAQQIADRIARIGDAILMRLVADSRARAVEADKTAGQPNHTDDGAAFCFSPRKKRSAGAPDRASPSATDLVGELVRRHTPPPRRPGKSADSGAPVMVRVDRRQRVRPAGKAPDSARTSDPQLLRRRAAEERERAAQAADAGARSSHRRLADLFWIAADQAEAQRPDMR